MWEGLRFFPVNHIIRGFPKPLTKEGKPIFKDAPHKAISLLSSTVLCVRCEWCAVTKSPNQQGLTLSCVSDASGVLSCSACSVGSPSTNTHRSFESINLLFGADFHCRQENQVNINYIYTCSSKKFRDNITVKSTIAGLSNQPKNSYSHSSMHKDIHSPEMNFTRAWIGVSYCLC